MKEAFKDKEWLLDYLTAKERKAFANAYQHEITPHKRIKRLQAQIKKLKASANETKQLMLRAEIRKISGLNR